MFVKSKESLLKNKNTIKEKLQNCSSLCKLTAAKKRSMPLDFA